MQFADAQPLFELLPSEKTGIDCINSLPENRYRNVIVYQYYYNGGGVGIGDLNGDGRPDIIMTRNSQPNCLYLNKGDFKFEEVAKQSNFVIAERVSWTTGVAIADINQDGKLDIYLSRSGKLQANNRKNLLYINQGNDEQGIPQFAEQAAAFGLDDSGYGVQTVFLDFDKDGDLDAYIMNHGTGFFAEPPASVLTTRDLDRGDKLMENQEGKYVDVTEKAGIKSTAIGYGLGVAVEDFNDDGWPDLYVSNDFFEHDYFYLNQKDGTFKETIKSAARHISNYSMGNDAADINNDGLADVMVVDMVAEDNRRLKANMSGMNPEQFYSLVNQGFHYQYMFNTLHLNRGNGSFSDIAQIAGTSNTDWSWAPLLADFDNDGWKDIYVSNGLRKDVRNTDFQNKFQEIIREASAAGQRDLTSQQWQNVLDMMPSERIANYVYQNKGGSGLHFQKVSEEWGLDQPGFSNGTAYGDLDGDGDLDLVVSNIDEKAFVYRNRTRELGKGNYLQLSLIGGERNKEAIGAKVKVRTGENWQYFSQYNIRGYQSSVEATIHIGLGSAQKVDELTLSWPDGTETRLKNVKANQKLKLLQEEAKVAKVKKDSENPIFKEMDLRVDFSFQHKENDFDDYSREVLLPHKMSQWGPTLALGDVNGDGNEDVFIGGAKGQAGEIYSSQKDGSFKKLENDFEKSHEDMGAIFFDADGDGDQDLYIASGGNESEDKEYYQDRLYFNDGQGSFVLVEDALPEISASASCVRALDIDGDGDLDLFVGGRQNPRNYPLPGESLILINDKGSFVNQIDAIAPGLKNAGMITDAHAMDIDNDKDQDLILTGEWMPIQIWENENGKLRLQQSISQSEGWWFSLALADMDGDGDQDIIGGNLGLNYKYKASIEEPFEVFSKDFDGNGSRDIVLSYYQEGNLYPLRGRSCSSQQIPGIKKTFPSYNEFALATVEDVYGGMGLNEALNYQAYTFASTWFENKGNEKWEAHPLPDMAQLSAIQTIITKDLNKDGHMDLILAGNLYVSEVETPRSDAGCGLVLLGDGKGGFHELGPKESGIFVPGDVRDAKLLDGRILLFTNNNDKIQFFELNPKYSK